LDKLYIIVEKPVDRYEDARFVTRGDEKEVLLYIGHLAARDSIDTEVDIEKIFSVSMYGDVIHYDVVFGKGRLKLEAKEARE
jgi:phage FluMu protein gp41